MRPAQQQSSFIPLPHQSIPIRVVHKALILLEISVACTGGRVILNFHRGHSITIRGFHRALILQEISVACTGGRVILNFPRGRSITIRGFHRALILLDISVACKGGSGILYTRPLNGQVGQHYMSKVSICYAVP